MTIKEDKIRTLTNLDCPICGARGEPLYQRLRDRLYSAPCCKWDLKKCPNPQYGLVWLDPMPIVEDIGKACLICFPHSVKKQEDVVHGKNAHNSVPECKAGGVVSSNYNLGLQGWAITL